MSDAERPQNTDAGKRATSSRRDFLRTASAPVLLAALGISGTSCKSNVIGAEEAPGVTIDGNSVILDLTVPDVEPLAQEGGFLLIRPARVMAINVDGATIRAFTSICTHLQCTITTFENDHFECRCHGSRFNTAGEVIRGPAEDDLEEYAVSRNGDIVTISR